MLVSGRTFSVQRLNFLQIQLHCLLLFFWKKCGHFTMLKCTGALKDVLPDEEQQADYRNFVSHGTLKSNLVKIWHCSWDTLQLVILSFLFEMVYSHDFSLNLSGNISVCATRKTRAHRIQKVDFPDLFRRIRTFFIMIFDMKTRSFWFQVQILYVDASLRRSIRFFSKISSSDWQNFSRWHSSSSALRDRDRSFTTKFPNFISEIPTCRSVSVQKCNFDPQYSFTEWVRKRISMMAIPV